MNGLAICAGIGGLELGLSLAVPSYRTVLFIEREAYAAATLVARMEDQTLDAAPIWDDVTSFNSLAWHSAVDCVTAGFPCQPFSVAGHQRGTEDERWIWPAIAEIVYQVGAWLVFLENVPAITTSGLGPVLGSLAKIGFDAEWGVFSAAGSGAPHLRRRLFILAYSDRERLRAQQKKQPGCKGSTISDGHGEKGLVAHADGVRKPQPEGRESDKRGRAGDGGWWEAEPDVGRVADGVPYRLDRHRALGNAVVPAVAARAYLTLQERALS